MPDQIKIAIITANVGGVDEVKPIPHQTIAYDYYYFDETNLPENVILSGDNAFISKYPKLMTHKLLPDYDIYIWIDGRVEVTSPNFIESMINGLGDVRMTRHPQRQTIQEEFDFIDNLFEQKDEYVCSRYKQEDIAKQKEIITNPDAALYACGVFARRNNQKVNEAFESVYSSMQGNYEQAIISDVLTTLDTSPVFYETWFKAQHFKLNPHKSEKTYDLDVVILSNAANDNLYNLTVQTIASVLNSAYYVKPHIYINEQNPKANYIHPDVSVLRFDEEFNYSKFNNMLFDCGKSDWVVFINNDVVVQPTAFDIMVGQCLEHKYVSCSANDTTNPWFNQLFKREINYMGYRTSLEMAGWCIMVERKSFVRFDDDFKFNYSDNAYAERLKKRGMEHWLIGAADVHHVAYQSQEIIPEERKDEFNIEPRRLFRERYKKALLAVCIIYADEDKDLLQKCLASVPQEFDVVLLKTQPGEKDCEEITEKISEFRAMNIVNYCWTYKPGEFSFAKARNICKSYAISDWILHLDSDELLSITSEDVDHLAGLEKSVGGVLVNLINLNVIEQKNVYQITRIYRNQPGIDYSNLCHEQVLDTIIKSGMQVVRSNIVIKHYGYSIDNQPKINAKFNRNLSLLSRDVRDNGFNNYLFFKLYETLDNLRLRRAFLVEPDEMKKLDLTTFVLSNKLLLENGVKITLNIDNIINRIRFNCDILVDDPINIMALRESYFSLLILKQLEIYHEF